MSANNNIFVRVLGIDEKKVETPYRKSIPCRQAEVVDFTTTDVPDVSSRMVYYFGGIMRSVWLDKSAQSIHDLINGARSSESGTESF